MYISLYTLYFNNLKFIKNFLFSIFYKNFFLIKNYSLLFFKIKYSLIIYYNNNYFKYLKNIIFFLNNFLQGFCFKLTLEGKKFKFMDIIDGVINAAEGLVEFEIKNTVIEI